MEAPFLWTSGGQFFLFYSANSYANGAHSSSSVLNPQPLALASDAVHLLTCSRRSGRSQPDVES